MSIFGLVVLVEAAVVEVQYCRNDNMLLRKWWQGEVKLYGIRLMIRLRWMAYKKR